MRRLIRLAAAACAAASLASTAQAAVTFHFDVDTTSLLGQDGFIDLFLAGADGPIELASASISDFVITGGTLNGAPETVGDVTGLLPGVLEIHDRDGVGSDYFQAVTFGGSFSFNLTLDGPRFASPCVAAVCFEPVFGLSLLDEDMAAPLLTDPGNPDLLGFLAGAVIVESDGGVRTAAAPALRITPVVGGGAVPEPASWALMIAGFGLVGGAVRRRRTLAA